jgi:sugar phosphate permease
VSGTGRFLSRVRPIYHGWWVLAVGLFAMALGSGLSMSSFGLYVRPLEEEFGWTRAETSLAFSIAVAAAGLVAPLIGRWTDSHGARPVIITGAAAGVVAFLLLASTQSLWQFYVFFALHTVFRQMMFFLPFQALASQWFRRRRGVALSILGSGFSLGGLLILPIVAAAIGEFGWRGAYVFSAGAMAVLVPLAFFVIRNRPSDISQYVDGIAPEARGAGEPEEVVDEVARSMTLREAAATPLFWICAVGFTLYFFGLIGWAVHQVPFYESRGISRASAALIVSMSAGASIAARLALGLIADRFERFEGVVSILMALLFSALATLLLSTAWFAIGVYLVFWVLGASAGPLLESLVLIKAFGLRHFGTIFGAMLVIEMVGEIVSPTAAGAIYDSTGSYDGALIMFMSAFTVGAVLFIFASKMALPQRPASGLSGAPAASA